MIDSTDGLIRRSANILLVLCLLTSSTPAAPTTVVALATETSISFAFWYQSSGLAKIVSGQSVTEIRQETQ